VAGTRHHVKWAPEKESDNFISLPHRPPHRVHDDVGVEGIEYLVTGQDRVRALLSELSPRERDVLACLEVVELDVGQTAKALGITPVAVRVARHRGLHRLRCLLTDDVVATPLPSP
jgi:DNA-directed RNA polymerase specialized sigma24 family protein